MAIVLELHVDRAKAHLNGIHFVWATILANTSPENPEFSEAGLLRICSSNERRRFRSFIEGLLSAGFLEAVADAPELAYRVLRRQSDTPRLTADGKVSLAGRGRQYMWNVMRRQVTGFSADSLAIDASTDEVQVNARSAKEYCTMLAMAGVIVATKPGNPSAGKTVYVLKGSANTGPRAPQQFRAKFVYDANTEKVLGIVRAEEVTA